MLVSTTVVTSTKYSLPTAFLMASSTAGDMAARLAMMSMALWEDRMALHFSMAMASMRFSSRSMEPYWFAMLTTFSVSI